MNSEISETIQATILGLGMQIPEIPAQRKFDSAECHAHFNAKILTEIYIGLVNTYRLIQKKFATPTLTPISLKSVYRFAA